MQIDMHFYGTYALARAAGLPPEVAKTVATAAEFVDDAVDKRPECLGGTSYIVPLVSAHHVADTSNVDAADQWQVWVPFHFLPGARGGSAEERLICRKADSSNQAAAEVLALAARGLDEPYGWHLLGVVTHVIQDTFSHWGFSGISSSYNHVDQGDIVLSEDLGHSIKDYITNKAKKFWECVGGSVAEELSALGHGSVATFPDRPYLKWVFDYEMDLVACRRQENTLHVERDNPTDFLQACELLFGVYAGMAARRFQVQPRPFAAISGAVLAILRVEKDKAGRIDAWKHAIATNALFQAEPEDKDLRYDGTCWAPSSLRTQPKAQKLEAQLFFKAARNYRCFVLGQLLPSLGLL